MSDSRQMHTLMVFAAGCMEQEMAGKLDWMEVPNAKPNATILCSKPIPNSSAQILAVRMDVQEGIDASWLAT